MSNVLPDSLKHALLLAAACGMLAACEGPTGADGSSCTIVDNGDGTKTISCDDGSSVTLDAKPGEDGKDGTDGSSCTITDNGDGTKTIKCDDGTTATVTDGTAGKSCTVKDNGDGTKTITCEDGTTVTIKDGEEGSTGEPGQSGGNVRITDHHGLGYLTSSGEFENGHKELVKATVTKATADAAGKVMVEFKVEDSDGKPVTDISSINVGIAKLVPAAGGESFSKWVPYIYRTEEVDAAGEWPAAKGTKADQGYRESSSKGTFVNNKDGSYAYTMAVDLTSVKTPVAGTSISYDRSLTHRITVTMGGHSGATATADYDFVPDGSAVTTTRNLMTTEPCLKCHGPLFEGHGGDRLTVENCVTCHNPSTIDANSGETVDMKVMIHKIHAGADLASIAGPDGIVFDDPSTTVDESADNGSYAIWGHNDRKHSWEKVGFPAVIENCTKCHQGSGNEVDNWKTVPSRDACGSCHDDINWTTGANHKAGAQTSDTNCAGCHAASSIESAHDWTTKDPRNIPEFDVELTVSTPANSTHFVKGEQPKVTIVIKDKTSGTAIDHTLITKAASAQGCPKGGPCPARDNAFSGLKLMINGPRALRMPVLTSAAHAKVTTAAAEPFNLSSATDLKLLVDAGKAVPAPKDASGGDQPPLSGAITVKVSSGTFANASAATAAEVVAWLNGDAGFAARAIAWAESDNKVSIRSRNLGTFYSVQLQPSDVTTDLFAGDTTIHNISGYYPYVDLRNPSADAKATVTAGSIVYQLDAVDDLKAGTYIASVEIADLGRKSATDYRTPSVAVTPFQVGTKTEEKPPARSCDSCHQGPDGKGFVLDFGRHNKIFGDMAVDQCGNCHDYLPRDATGAWAGGHPISKRVHAVHVGGELHYPNDTVGHSDGIPGRNWDIELPGGPLVCESCHGDNTSGSWKTNATRLPCMGCHDSDQAKAHFKLQTYDPTPANPWSGDEQESCKTCH